MSSEGKIHQYSFLNNDLPDKCVQLIIADPPYYKTKGKFDFIWKTFEDYLKDVEKWAIECKRLLADNGTLFWWGHALKIAYSQIILDKYFNLENNIKWLKTDCQTRRGSNGYKCFPPVTEHLLMYSNEVIRTGLEKIMLDVNNFKSLRNYFKGLQKFIGSKNEIINKIGGKADHPFRHSSTQWDLPTEETYNELINHFNINNWRGFKEYEELRREYEELRREYEELRREYEELRRHFDNYLQFDDVWSMGQEAHISQKYVHDTVKPEKLTRYIILTTTRKNDLVFVPFAGSGTECAMAKKEGRRFIGFDIEKKYVDMGNKRVEKIRSEPVLF